MTGVLQIDIKDAFLSVANGRLVNAIKVKQMRGDLIGWTESFQSERTVEMIIEGREMERHPLEARVPQGSPVSLNSFAINTSRLIEWIQEDSLHEGLSNVADLTWVVTRSIVNQLVTIVERCTAVVSTGCG